MAIASTWRLLPCCLKRALSLRTQSSQLPPVFPTMISREGCWTRQQGRRGKTRQQQGARGWLVRQQGKRGKGRRCRSVVNFRGCNGHDAKKGARGDGAINDRVALPGGERRGRKKEDGAAEWDERESVEEGVSGADRW